MAGLAGPVPEVADAPYFTEAVARLSDRSDAVPDVAWEEASRYCDERALAALITSIALINTWNRLNVTHSAGRRRLGEVGRGGKSPLGRPLTSRRQTLSRGN